MSNENTINELHSPLLKGNPVPSSWPASNLQSKSEVLGDPEPQNGLDSFKRSNPLETELSSARQIELRIRTPKRWLNRFWKKKPYRRVLRRKPSDDQFGVKTIGQIGSFVYLVNQIFGTGVIAIPENFILSGWCPCLLADAFVCIAAVLGTLMMLRCMTLVKGNRNFEKRLEYMSVIKCFLNKPLYGIIQVCFYLSMLASNLISIVVVAQAFDHIIACLLGQTFSLQFYPSFGLRRFENRNIESMYTSDVSLTFGASIGYVLTAITCIPLSQQTMEENMKVQWVSFSFLLITLSGLSLNALATSSSFSSLAPELSTPSQVPLISNRRLLAGVETRARLPAFGQHNYRELLSTFLASYSYVNVVPSWANEMRWDVNVGRAVCMASLFAFLVYYVFGFLMAYAYPDADSDNILQVVLSRSDQSKTDNRAALLGTFLVYAFDLITIAPGILVYCITTRYNLLNSKACNVHSALFWSSIFPFLIAWTVSDNDHFSSMLSWSALVFSLMVNFVAPCLIFLVACCTSRPSIKNPIAIEEHNSVQAALRDLGGQISLLCASKTILRKGLCFTEGVELVSADDNTSHGIGIGYDDDSTIGSVAQPHPLEYEFFRDQEVFRPSRQTEDGSNENSQRESQPSLESYEFFLSDHAPFEATYADSRRGDSKSLESISLFPTPGDRSAQPKSFRFVPSPAAHDVTMSTNTTGGIFGTEDVTPAIRPAAVSDDISIAESRETTRKKKMSSPVHRMYSPAVNSHFAESSYHLEDGNFQSDWMDDDSCLFPPPRKESVKRRTPPHDVILMPTKIAKLVHWDTIKLCRAQILRKIQKSLDCIKEHPVPKAVFEHQLNLRFGQNLKNSPMRDSFERGLTLFSKTPFSQRGGTFWGRNLTPFGRKTERNLNRAHSEFRPQRKRLHRSTTANHMGANRSLYLGSDEAPPTPIQQQPAIQPNNLQDGCRIVIKAPEQQDITDDEYHKVGGSDLSPRSLVLKLPSNTSGIMSEYRSSSIESNVGSNLALSVSLDRSPFKPNIPLTPSVKSSDDEDGDYTFTGTKFRETTSSGLQHTLNNRSESHFAEAPPKSNFPRKGLNDKLGRSFTIGSPKKDENIYTPIGIRRTSQPFPSLPVTLSISGPTSSDKNNDSTASDQCSGVSSGLLGLDALLAVPKSALTTPASLCVTTPKCVFIPENSRLQGSGNLLSRREGGASTGRLGLRRNVDYRSHSACRYTSFKRQDNTNLLISAEIGVLDDTESTTNPVFLPSGVLISNSKVEEVQSKQIITGAEDAYEQDEDLFGELEDIRIRVFPTGFLRRNHIEFTVLLLCALVFSCCVSTVSKVLTDFAVTD